MAEEKGCKAFEEWWEKEYKPQSPISIGGGRITILVYEKRAAMAAWDALSTRINKIISESFRGI